MSAADVGDPSPGLELGDDAVERGQPGVDEVRDVAGLEEPFGPDEQAGVVLVPAEAVAGAEPVGDGVDVPEGADGDLHARGEVGRAVRVGEGRGLLRAQRIPVVAVLGVVGDVPARRLVREPRPQVGDGEAGAVGEGLGGDGRAVGHGAVDAEPVADERPVRPRPSRRGRRPSGR